MKKPFAVAAVFSFNSQARFAGRYFYAYSYFYGTEQPKHLAGLPVR